MENFTDSAQAKIAQRLYKFADDKMLGICDIPTLLSDLDSYLNGATFFEDSSYIFLKKSSNHEISHDTLPGFISLFYNNTNKTLLICLNGTKNISDFITDFYIANRADYNHYIIASVPINDKIPINIHGGFAYYAILALEFIIRASGTVKNENIHLSPPPIDIERDFKENYVFFDSDVELPTELIKSIFNSAAVENVYIVGHSLGGAASSILATSYNFTQLFFNSTNSKNINLLTFGAPALGNSIYCDYYNSILTHYSFFHCKRYLIKYDPVPIIISAIPSTEYVLDQVDFARFMNSLYFSREYADVIFLPSVLYSSINWSRSAFIKTVTIGSLIAFGLSSLYKISVGTYSSFYHPSGIISYCLPPILNNNINLENHYMENYVVQLGGVSILTTNELYVSDVNILSLDIEIYNFLKNNYKVTMNIFSADQGSEYTLNFIGK